MVGYFIRGEQIIMEVLWSERSKVPRQVFSLQGQNEKSEYMSAITLNAMELYNTYIAQNRTNIII